MLIETMPKYIGHQLYPDGYPLPANRISINGRTMVELLMESETVGFYKNVANVDLLEDYYRYYLLAPCWRRIGTFSMFQQVTVNPNSQTVNNMCKKYYVKWP